MDDKLLAAFMRAANKRITTIGDAAKKELNANNPELSKAKEYEKAAVKFLTDSGRGHYPPWPKDAAGILKELYDAKMDEGIKADRQHLEMIAQRFQNDIISLTNMFLVVANKGLMARNELGEHIVSAFGSPTDESISILKKHTKDNCKELQDIILQLSEGKEQTP